MAKTKNKKIEFIYDNNFETVFTDLIQIDAKIETVSFELAVKDREDKTAVITHRVIMTLPHFLRFVEVSNNLASEIHEKIEEFKKEE